MKLSEAAVAIPLLSMLIADTPVIVRFSPSPVQVVISICFPIRICEFVAGIVILVTATSVLNEFARNPSSLV